MKAILESGLLQKWQKNHWPKEGNKCHKLLSSIGHTRTKIQDTSGAYVALTLGIAVSFLVLLIEVLSKMFQARHIRLSIPKEEQACLPT